MIFQKSQSAETEHECLSSASTGPLKIWLYHPPPPHEKRTRTKYTNKLAVFRTLSNCHGSYERYEEMVFQKAGVEANRP
jgi:hypothetical protein